MDRVAVKFFYKVLNTRETRIDDFVFRLHYRSTYMLLVTASVLATAYQYFGKPISCIQGNDVPGHVLNTYCWIHSTFTLPDSFNKTVGKDIPHPGIENYTPGERRIYHKYYQWVWLVLSMQAVLFFVPHMLWKRSYGGKLRLMVEGVSTPILGPRNPKLDRLIEVFLRETSLSRRGFYHYTFCSILNLVVVWSQSWLLNSFLGEKFSTLGTDYFGYSEMDQDVRTDPLIHMFPRMTKCTFHRYGSSGDVQKYDALCLLSANIIYEKIYLFFWVWFKLLTIVTFLHICHLFAMNIRNYRVKLLHFKVPFASNANIFHLTRSISKGDWFSLYLVAGNLDRFEAKYVVDKLAYEKVSMENEYSTLKK